MKRYLGLRAIARVVNGMALLIIGLPLLVAGAFVLAFVWVLLGKLLGLLP
jgi:hypothetical protein